MIRHRKTCQLLAGITALFVCGTSALAKDIDERNWILMKSGNFSIHSSLSERKTRELLVHLEALRSVVTVSANSPSQLSRKPTRILAVANSSDYKSLGMPENSGGVFIGGLRENYIVIRISSGMSTSQVILHEYLHSLQHTSDRMSYPKWWDEGYAEFASASKLSKANFKFGTPLEGRIRHLANDRWLPWMDVLSFKSLSGLSGSQRAMFYAQAWLLVHFLHNRDDEPASIHESWSRYSARILTGSSPVRAFQYAFGLSPTELTEQVQQYFAAGRYRFWSVPRDELKIDLNVTSGKISQIEIQLQLGRLALHQGRPVPADEWFNKVLQSEPQNADAIAGLGSALTEQDLFDDAKKQFDMALELAPDNSRVLFNYGIYYIKLAAAPDAWFTRQDHLKKAQELMVKARSIAGGTVEIDTNLAAIWLYQDPDSEAAARLLDLVIKQSPTDMWPRLLLAECFERAGFPDAAVELAESVIRFDHGDSANSKSANRIVERIRGEGTSPEYARPLIAPPTLPPTD